MATETKIVRGVQRKSVTKVAKLVGMNLSIERELVTNNVVREENISGAPIRTLYTEELSREKETLTCFLRETSTEELNEHRRNGTPMFIYKKGDILYCTEIPKNLNLLTTSVLEKCHKCASPGKECCRLLAASDEEGGCTKVRDRGRQKRIEKYPFVEEGYETIGTWQKVLIVAECTRATYNVKPTKKKTNRKA